MMPQREELVEAIEDGKIVRVHYAYAKQEGLLILRKPQIKDPTTTPVAQEIKKERQQLSRFETFRKPLRGKENNVISTLVHNFHWIISTKRKERGLNRKQLAQALGESEYTIKLIENGVLPADDYVLVSKIERYFATTLRKERLAQVPALSPPAKKPTQSSTQVPSKTPPPSKTQQQEPLLGKEIEVIDDS